MVSYTADKEDWPWFQNGRVHRGSGKNNVNAIRKTVSRRVKFFAYSRTSDSKLQNVSF